MSALQPPTVYARADFFLAERSAMHKGRIAAPRKASRSTRGPASREHCAARSARRGRNSPLIYPVSPTCAPGRAPRAADRAGWQWALSRWGGRPLRAPGALSATPPLGITVLISFRANLSPRTKGCRERGASVPFQLFSGGAPPSRASSIAISVLWGCILPVYHVHLACTGTAICTPCGTRYCIVDAFMPK